MPASTRPASRNSLYALVTESTKVSHILLCSGHVTTITGSDVQEYSDGIGSRGTFLKANRNCFLIQ
jgi:hypothetical protein